VARINIDDDWFTDPRRFKLAELVGSETLADGCMVEAWRVAQSFWRQGKRLVPVPVYNKIPYAELILKVGLAKHKGARIYVNGSTVRFRWLVKASTNGKAGGVASGRSRRAKTEANAKPMRSQCEPSLSSSLSISSSKNKARAQSENIGGRQSPSQQEIQVCIEEWNQTLRHRAIERDARIDEVVIARLAARYGPDRTRMALRGMRYEPGDKNFDPAANCYIARLDKPDAFNRFESLGAHKANQPTDRKYFEEDAELQKHQ
jgi:hypothetical protein